MQDHPVNISKETLENELRELIKNKEKIIDLRRKAKGWVYKNHDISKVSKVI